MNTRIREFRKRHGLTLQQVAQKLGTTAQTVQRLETANMTVSMDWLERFARVFGVTVSELIIDGASRGIPLLGKLPRTGLRLGVGKHETPNEHIFLTAPADQPVAVQLSEAIGPYARSTILIGDKLQGSDIIKAHGHDCIVASSEGHVALARLLVRDGTTILVPLDQTDEIRFDVTLAWAARIVLAALYF